MCELFGLNARKRVKCNDLLTEFFSHGNEHPHGWGLAFLYHDAVSIEKEPVCSLKSTYLKYRMGEEICANRMLAHIRLATKGSIEYVNTHPFVKRDNQGRCWTLEHNGTIFESELLHPYVYRQKGQTDSERILYYIVDRINREQKTKSLSAEDRFLLMDEILHEITPENKVNLLVYDGELLYAHANCPGSLFRCMREGTVFISTRPLNRENWEEMPLNVLCAYHNGQEAFHGKDHGNEFIFSEEKMKYLFLDYAGI